jgi:hypothetical protein
MPILSKSGRPATRKKRPEKLPGRFFHSPTAIEIFGFRPAVVTLQRDNGAPSPESQKNIQ